MRIMARKNKTIKENHIYMKKTGGGLSTKARARLCTKGGKKETDHDVKRKTGVGIWLQNKKKKKRSSGERGIRTIIKGDPEYLSPVSGRGIPLRKQATNHNLHGGGERCHRGTKKKKRVALPREQNNIARGFLCPGQKVRKNPSRLADKSSPDEGVNLLGSGGGKRKKRSLSRDRRKENTTVVGKVRMREKGKGGMKSSDERKNNVKKGPNNWLHRQSQQKKRSVLPNKKNARTEKGGTVASCLRGSGKKLVGEEVFDPGRGRTHEE